MANTFLTTDFNTSPYFDDYDPSRGYYRIIHRPAVAVQTRELTQVQTMTQKQIARFADNIFKDGSLVTGGEFNLDTLYTFVKVSDIDTFGNSVDVTDYLGLKVTGQTSGVAGIIVNGVTGAESNAPDTKTLYIKYTTSGTNNTSKVFTPGETLVSNTGLSVVSLVANTSVGTGTAFTINEGVVYAKEFFISFPQQTVIVDKYTNLATATVGFRIDESIVTHLNDNTLLDNASGTSNYTAPGADRLKLTPVLVSYTVTAPDDNFVELFRIQDGIVQEKYDRPQYSIIKEELARRTFDESGDYLVKGMNIRVREHLNDTTNGGVYTAAAGGNSSMLAIGVAEGKAYVRGFDVENLVTSYVPIDKGIDFKVAEQQVVSANYGNYLYVKEVVGQWPVNALTVVSLYDAPSTRVTSLTYSPVAPSGNFLGTAKLRTLQYDNGTIGLANTVYRAYLYDVNMSNGSFNNVRSLYTDNTNADLGADVIVDAANNAVLNESNFNTTVYKIASSNIRKIRDVNGNIDATYSFLKSFDVSVATGGTFTVSTGSADEIFPFSAGALNSTQKNENFVVNLNANASVSLVGTISVTSGANTVTGSNTAFVNNFNIGSKIKVGTSNEIRRVASVTNNTFLTVTSNFANTQAAVSYKKAYLTGDVLNYSANGSSGALRTITVSTSTSTDFDFKETFDAVVSATVTTQLNKIDAREKLKVLRKSRYVLIDCGTNVNTTSGPWLLGVPDVIRIVDVRKATSFAATTDGVSILDSFTFDNGQRDALYDHARLIKKPTLTLAGSDKLLVKFDYFEHDASIGKGYFSVDSYPIDDVNGAANTNAITTKEIPFFVSPVSGISYDLRDSIDVRPSKILTANSATSLTGITTNPLSNNSMLTPSGGLYFPAPNSNFTMDLSYYLPRKDLITVSKSGFFGSVRGLPSLSPITPAAKTDAMTLAVVDVAPFPSLPVSVANAYGRLSTANKVTFVGNDRYTMKDIGTLDQRITNLEYYTQVSLLEKNTLDLKILDTNGLDRFKNGILVDPFTSHVIGDLDNPDYNIAIDSVANEIRPTFSLNDIPLTVATNTHVAITGDLVTLPYTHGLLIDQSFASTTRNTAGLFYFYNGVMTLNPSTDYWNDITKLPDLTITSNNGSLDSWNKLANSYGTQWNSWQTTWTGVSTSTSTSGNSTTTKTTTTQNQNKTGTTLVVQTNNRIDDYGTRVVDASIIPYMRSREIKVYASGVKPNTKVYAFFDSEAVGAYMQPCNSSYVATGPLGANLVSSAIGEIYAKFMLPSTDSLKFTVGSKVLRYTDSFNNANDLGSVTTSAESTYTAFGLNEVKQNTIVSTTTTSLATRNLTETRTLVSTATSTVTVNPPEPSGGGGGGGHGPQPDYPGQPESQWWDPIAQTFTVSTGIGAPGLFITKADFFFASKDPVYGAYVEFRELDASGLVTRKIIPFSQKKINNAQINVSNNASLATTVTFDAPVYLLDGTDYAVVIKPEGNNPNTVVWTARLGDTDLTTGSKITSQPYAGVLQVSSNDKTYTAIQTEDLKFRLYRAVFDISSTGQVGFVNQKFNFLTGNTVSGSWNIPQEVVYGEYKLTLGSIANGSISVGHKIHGLLSNTTGTITDINGSIYRVKGVSANVSFNSSENVTLLYANNSATGVTASITASNVSSSILEYYAINKDSSASVKLNTTNGTFAVGENIVGQSSNSSMTIQSIDNMPVNLYSLNASQVLVSGTLAAWEIKTTDSSYALDGSYSSVVINENFETSNEKMVASAVNETALMSGANSLQLRATLSSYSNFVSPVINKARTHSILIHNLINNDSTNENAASGGNAIDKYITQKVTLAEGQDAEDLNLYLTIYKPPASNVLLFYKILHNEDSDIFAQRPWKPMTMLSKDFTSDRENKQDFREFKYGIPTTDLTGSNSEVQYVNSNGITFTGFKYFSIKAVLLSSNSSEIPRAKELRVIALQK